MTKEFDLLVFIGRFQPFHNGHKAVIEEGLRRANAVAVVIGSAYEARTLRNPFTYEEREEMIKTTFNTHRITCVPAKDYPYDDGKWIRNIQRQLEITIEAEKMIQEKDDIKIGLIGHSKDHTSYYLKIFPDWDHVEVDNVDGIDATDIRNEYLEFGKIIIRKLPTKVSHVLSRLLVENEDISKLREEYMMIKKYKESWKSAPYPPTFVTTDAVVTQSGHVLLVERKHAPGKGLLALPGGFINQNETLLNACIRELREETKLKVPAPVLKGSVKRQHVFDAPNRSARGRTITHAFHMELEPMLKLPKVKGSDDAERAMWIPFADIKSDNMFEDHYHIIDFFCNIG